MRRTIFVCLLAIVGCAHRSTQAGDMSMGDERVPVSGQDQVAMGAKLFAQHCAECHGKSGQGTKKAPMLIGKNALPETPRPSAKRRHVEFKTAGDVYVWASKHMPLDDPGSLTADQYAAIVAYVLSANGIDMSGQVGDAETFEAIRLH